MRRTPISHKEQIVIFFSGTMRGCVAFALALKVDEDEHGLEEGVFSTTILAISIFTTLVFGGISAPVLMALGLKSAPGGSHGVGAAGDVRTAGSGVRAPLLGAGQHQPYVGESVCVRTQHGADRSRLGSPIGEDIAMREEEQEQEEEQVVAATAAVGAVTLHGPTEFGHPASFSGQPTGLPSRGDASLQARSNGSEPDLLRSTSRARRSGGRFHRKWKEMDETYFKPWFGGLPRAPDALETKLASLQSDLARAQEKLAQEQRAVGEQDELVNHLHLEVVDVANQVALVGRRVRNERARARAEQQQAQAQAPS